MGEQARFPGLSLSSTRRTMPNPCCAAPDLARLGGFELADDLLRCVPVRFMVEFPA